MKQRVKWVDMCKGLVMVLTVYMHCGLSSIPYMSSIVNIFYMPLFFILSGLFMNTDKYVGVVAFVKHRWYTLYRPFLFFFLVVMTLAKPFKAPLDSWPIYIENTLVWGGGLCALVYPCISPRRALKLHFRLVL